MTDAAHRKFAVVRSLVDTLSIGASSDDMADLAASLFDAAIRLCIERGMSKAELLAAIDMHFGEVEHDLRKGPN